MSRRKLEDKLREISDFVLEMAEYVKVCLDALERLLASYSEEEVEVIMEYEEKSDLLNLKVDEKCLSTLALQQPVASDLRFIASMLKISANYERICDIARKITFLLKGGVLEEVKDELLKIVEVLKEMLRVNVDGLKGVKVDELITELKKLDDVIDKLNRGVRARVPEVVKANCEKVEEGLKAVIVSLYLERIGDILAKSGSRIVFAKKGVWVWIK